MYALKIKNEKVIRLLIVDKNYKPKDDDEVVVNELPQLDLKQGERAYLFYRKKSGKIEYEIKKGE